MSLTSETMAEYTELWNDEGSAPDEPGEREAGVTACVVVLIADGELRVDPLELF